VLAGRDLEPPRCQRSLRASGVVFDPVHRLPGQASLLGNPCDTDGLLPQHVSHLGELGAREARLASEVRSVSVLLRVLDTGPLSGLGGLGLCLSPAA
jgi:hypothetical protein